MTLEQLAQEGRFLFNDYLSFEAKSGNTTSDITLRFGFNGKFYSKTISMKDSQDGTKVQAKWNEIFGQLFNDFNPASNVQAGNKGDDMSVQEKLDQLAQVAQELVQEVKAEGGQYTQADLDTVKAEGETKLQAAHAELVLAQEEIAKVKSDDEADKAAIKEGQAKLEAIKAILVPVLAPAPEVEVPTEETVVEAQP